MLRLYRLKNPYSRENIAEAIIAIIKTYKIINKIGYFVLDNAGLNNTYISAIIKQLNIKDKIAYFTNNFVGFNNSNNSFRNILFRIRAFKTI